MLPSVTIDDKLDEPVYGQIARQIREAIGSGTLAAGVTLPAVRTLASDLGVNLNTVARAYRVLEEEGFVEIQDREGARVAAPGSHGSVELRRRLTEELRRLVVRLRQAGFGARDLRRLALRQIVSVFAPHQSGRNG